MSPADAIFAALIALPPGRWVVGVSGGADSVALLRALVTAREDVTPIVAHLDHQTRGGASTADAAFVRNLGASLHLTTIVATRDQLPVDKANPEAAYRAARLALFERVVREHNAIGVLLAHHADDRAETTLLRLLRGGEAWTLDGLHADTTLDGLRVARPLRKLRRVLLETYCNEIGQPWRIDASNASDQFARNRVRAFLNGRPDLFDTLLQLADASAQYRAALPSVMPDESFAIGALADLPDPVARRTARRWLRARGCPADALTADVAERLIAMARDASTASRADFPGGISVRRRSGQIFVDGKSPAS